MNTKPKLLQLFLGLILIPGFAIFLSNSAPTTPPAYVEPGLWTHQSENLAVIVTAGNSKAADQAVEQAGGQVSSDLWIIDAVAATLPAAQLPRLAADPAVISITDNKGVKTSAKPDPYWPWLTDKAWPVTDDIGAVQLHDAGITGAGIGVAVIDSGIYFSSGMWTPSNQQLAMDFSVQIDLLETQKCDAYDSWNRHCYQGIGGSIDPYGHGSHVSSTIANRYKDKTTGIYLGIAPYAKILSVRALDDTGVGTYENVIRAIQLVIERKNLGIDNIRVLNLSLSANATTPYFADPLNRAVEKAWAAGIVVVAAAGNEGPASETITVPGNDPYVITVGAVESNRTANKWSDDYLAGWSSTGPTLDGFPKPDVLAPGGRVVAFMYKDNVNRSKSAKLAQDHPDYTVTTSLFRMSGTSMATAVTSGVVALMLQAHPELTPNQVKYRLMVSSRPGLASGTPQDIDYNIFQQGMGRIWAPTAVNGSFPVNGEANYGMNINTDLTHGLGWVDVNENGIVEESELSASEMAYHYQGEFGRMLSDDGRAYMYYFINSSGDTVAMGVAWKSNRRWLTKSEMSTSGLKWKNGQVTWSTTSFTWAGGISYGGGRIRGGTTGWGASNFWGSGNTWAGGRTRGGNVTWGGGTSWSGGSAWGGSYTWSGGRTRGGSLSWNGGSMTGSGMKTTTWVGDTWTDTGAAPGLTAFGLDLGPTGASPTTIYLPMVFK